MEGLINLREFSSGFSLKPRNVISPQKNESNPAGLDWFKVHSRSEKSQAAHKKVYEANMSVKKQSKVLYECRSSFKFKNS